MNEIAKFIGYWSVNSSLTDAVETGECKHKLMNHKRITIVGEQQIDDDQ